MFDAVGEMLRRNIGGESRGLRRCHWKRAAFLAVMSFVGGCTAAQAPMDASSRSNVIPENVVAIAAPYQDVSTARILPQDGCYWYLHSGPVETTLVPLRTREGRPICTARE